MDADKRLKDLAVSETGFVFDPHSGATFSTNPTGLAILHGLKRGDGRVAIRDALVEAFDTSGADLERDLDEFFQLLRHHGVISDDLKSE